MAHQLKKGERIGEYVLTTDGTTAGSGTAQWAFASSEGREYFLKQFLHPVYPTDDAPGTPSGKAKRRTLAESFERRIRTVEEALSRVKDGGFVVRAKNFFRMDGIYYKVTDKIDVASVDVASLTAEQQKIILLTVAFSIQALHERECFVHADLKPDNVIIQPFRAGFVAKLIDFDASFFEDDVPLQGDIVGDPAYQAPEMIQYLAGTATLPPGQAIDAFALGLIFSVYLSGSLPAIPSRYSYVGEAVLAGHTPEIPPPKERSLAFVVDIIRDMLAADPRSRLKVRDAFAALRAGGLSPRPDKAPIAPAATPIPASRLRHSGGLGSRPAAGAESSAARAPGKTADTPPPVSAAPPPHGSRDAGGSSVPSSAKSRLRFGKGR